jgi:GNAT superfamily N-acetyltransferase
VATGLVQIERLNERQAEELHALYQGEWWTKGRELAAVRRMLVESDLLVGYCERESGRLIAFARVLTDFTFKALVLDVIVAPAYRGRQLGRALLDAVVHHPRLGDVKHLELYCRPELVPFYEHWGFTAALGELRFMRLTRGETMRSPGQPQP